MKPSPNQQVIRARVTALAFDFDGTLVDSGDIKRQAFMTAMDAGRSVRQDQCERAYTRHLVNNREILLARSFRDVHGRAATPAENKELVAAYSDYFWQHVHDIRVFPGLREFAAGVDIPMAIVSNAPQLEIPTLCGLLGISDHFRAFYGYPTPKPDALSDFAVELGVPRSQVLYVGDRPEDGLAAESAGCQFFRLDPRQTDESERWPSHTTLQELASHLNGQRDGGH